MIKIRSGRREDESLLNVREEKDSEAQEVI